MQSYAREARRVSRPGALFVLVTAHAPAQERACAFLSVGFALEACHEVDRDGPACRSALVMRAE